MKEAVPPRSRRDVIRTIGVAGVAMAGTGGAASQAAAQGSTGQAAPAKTPSPEERLEAIAQDTYPKDERRRLSFLVRTRAALLQPETQPKPAQTPDRKTHFSKVLSRTRVAGEDSGLAEEAGFKALTDNLARAFDTPETGPETDFDTFDRELRPHIGRGISGRDTPRLRFTNPFGGLAFDLEALDAQAARIRKAPDFGSSVTAAEMAEAYWIALLRDVPLSHFMKGGDKPAARAATDGLNKYSYFKNLGGVAPETLFRADLRDHNKNKNFFGFNGARSGPFVSQFLFRGTTPSEGSPIEDAVEFGTLRPSQKQKTVKAGMDYLFTPDRNPDGKEWYAVQNGNASAIGTDQFESGLYFIRNMRDGANYVHFDKIYQEYLLTACLILAAVPNLGASFTETLMSVTDFGARVTAQGAGSAEQAPVGVESDQPRAALVSEQGAIRDSLLNFGNPYFGVKAQVGFATFGLTHIVTMLAEVSTRAHKAGWYQKWAQLRLRPEEFASRVHYGKIKGSNVYGIHDDLWVRDQDLLALVAAHNQQQNEKAGKWNRLESYLLPMAFPEGCPTHPAYPSGHACAAGACVAMLKSFFNETATFYEASQVFMPSDDGRSYATPPDRRDLTIGGELNKLASNIVMFRTMAGVHWRSDQVQGLLLGEQVAIQLLIEQSNTFKSGSKNVSLYRERRAQRPFIRFTLFSGQAIEIRDGKLFRFDNDVMRDDGSYLTLQHQWGTASKEISFEDLVSAYQRIPEYPA
jgi:hypothetical protein